MHLKIKTAKLTPWDYGGVGHNITITRVWLYDSDGVFTKRVKLNDVVLNTLIGSRVEISLDLFDTPWTEIEKSTETSS